MIYFLEMYLEILFFLDENLSKRSQELKETMADRITDNGMPDREVNEQGIGDTDSRCYNQTA